MGGEGRLCPDTSDLDLLRGGKGVIDRVTELTNAALDVGVALQMGCEAVTRRMQPFLIPATYAASRNSRFI